MSFVTLICLIGGVILAVASGVMIIANAMIRSDHKPDTIKYALAYKRTKPTIALFVLAVAIFSFGLSRPSPKQIAFNNCMATHESPAGKPDVTTEFCLNFAERAP